MAQTSEHHAESLSSTQPTLPLQALEWRLVGPYRGGRVVAVAGDPSQSHTFYFGSTGGGVWKTTDGGIIWQNVSDGYFKRASVGAIAVASSDPQVIYVGMGEGTIRGNVSHGDGVYRSTDGGQTWKHLGLEATRNIGKVRVDPRDPDVAYVAALGHAHGPNHERGVYRTRDGGRSWELVLHRGENAGAVDLSMDPNNPRILYATFWEARRGPHYLSSGGEGSGIFKSTDGGDTWTDQSRNPGLPKGMLGKIGVAVSPAQANRVYAIVEAEDGAVFRSDDGGQTWLRLSEDRNLRGRAWYYHAIIADPQDPETVWVLATDAFKSIDGGRTFVQVAVPHGDNHDLWIDPHNPQRMIEGNDGGATVSFNGGGTWTTLYNQPTAEFYHVTADTQTPYRLYGSQQDNTSITVPSRSALMAITQFDYFEFGGGESGYISVRPDRPNIIFAGSYQGLTTRYNHQTGQIRDVTVWPETGLGAGAKDVKYRFQWTAPLLLSPHDPNLLYTAGNHAFRSTDEGVSWEQFSPDLTRHDPATLELSGGPITRDNTGAEYYATIFAFAESPVTRGVFWAGSDDGLVHVSRDDGASWENVTPKDLPQWALISILEPSPHDAATAYLAATRYKLDDFEPYLYKTTDYGKTWTKITTGIAADDFTRVIREDPHRQGLLYAGTETGVFVSFDDGGHWQSLQRNLPVVPIHDLMVKVDDLLAATHGRAFWILDDLTPLRELADAPQQDAVYLCTPRPAVRFQSNGLFPQAATPGMNYRMIGATMLSYDHHEKPDGTTEDRYLDAGKNPPDGVLVHYQLREAPDGPVTLTIFDAQDKEIRSFTSESPDEPTKPAESQSKTDAEPAKRAKPPKVAKQAGLNRFIWDMRYPGAEPMNGYAGGEGALEGPLAAPGTYSVRLRVGDHTSTAKFEIRKDPRIEASDDDLTAQFQLLLQIRDTVTKTHQTVNQLRSIRQQVDEWIQRAEGHPSAEQVVSAGTALKEQVARIENELIEPQVKSFPDALGFPPKLQGKLLSLKGTVASADAAPTRSAREVYAVLAQRIDEQMQALRKLLDTDIAAFGATIRATDLPVIVPQSKVRGAS